VVKRCGNALHASAIAANKISELKHKSILLHWRKEKLKKVISFSLFKNRFNGIQNV